MRHFGYIARPTGSRAMIRRTICSALLVTLAIGAAACAQTPPASDKPARTGGLVHTPAPPPPEIHDDNGAPHVTVGGYTGAGAVNEADANQKAARDFAVAEIYKKFPQRGRVESSTVKTQVVAGLNYQFHIVMTGGNAYDAVVYRDLKNNLSVTSLSKVGG
jgi:hypothetical protein